MTSLLSGPEGVTAGPDGALWFTATSNSIARMTTIGAYTGNAIPTAQSGPYGIVSGPDGALWFTEFGNPIGCIGCTPQIFPNLISKIGRITTAGAFTEFTTPTANSGPQGITSGPDGALWFAESLGNKIGRITTAGAFTEYPVPTSGGAPDGITSGPDGALWFTEYGGNKIGRLR